MEGEGSGGGEDVQNLYVMRHAERLDNCDRTWQQTAQRWWDPPLSENGKLQAWQTGKQLRKHSHITRVICSPFLRCVQTAAEVVAALCAQEDYADAPSSQDVVIDPSKLKVSIEIGLCEVLNLYAMRSQSSSDINWTPCKDIKWTLDRPELEAILPAGTIDHTVDPVWQELPEWEESMDAAHKRYSNTFLALADKFPQENLLCVTHGVGVSVSAFKEDIMVYKVDYCAVLHSRRTIFRCSTDRVEVKKFDVLTQSGSSGIQYLVRGT